MRSDQNNSENESSPTIQLCRPQPDLDELYHSQPAQSTTFGLEKRNPSKRRQQNIEIIAFCSADVDGDTNSIVLGYQ